LKGPNAAALYGSRAAHGVVLITTKTGKSGTKGFGVTFNSGFTFSTVATLPTFQNVFGQGTSGAFSYVDGKGGGINDGVDESWGPEMNGQLIPQFNEKLPSKSVAIPIFSEDFKVIVTPTRGCCWLSVTSPFKIVWAIPDSVEKYINIPHTVYICFLFFSIIIFLMY